MSLDELLKSAKLKTQAGDLAAAAALLDAAPAELRGAATWHYARGTVALRAKNLPFAVKQFERAVELEPEIPEMVANLGGALIEQAQAGDKAALPRALGLLERCCEMDPVLPDAHTNLGMARLLSGNAKGALEAFEGALKRDPRHVPALYDKAAALSALGRQAECLKALDATLKVDPKFAPALESRKSTLKKLGR